MAIYGSGGEKASTKDFHGDNFMELGHSKYAGKRLLVSLIIMI
jgi:hypothetical protein